MTVPVWVLLLFAPRVKGVRSRKLGSGIKENLLKFLILMSYRTVAHRSKGEPPSFTFAVFARADRVGCWFRWPMQLTWNGLHRAEWRYSLFPRPAQ